MTIRHIDDLLPHIEGRDDFIVIDNGDYKVVDYLFRHSDTFSNPVRREARGVKFHSDDGSLMALPFHKFFNVGEAEAGDIDWIKPFTILEKLDGSMIHPAILDGKVVFMTRKGRTDIAIKAEELFKDWKMYNFCKTYLENGFLPIFEFIGPSNPHVVAYEKDRLVLLAIRDQVGSQVYLPEEPMAKIADIYGLDMRRSFPFDGDIETFLSQARGLPDDEGYVFQFENEMYKIKADQYVLKHRAKNFFHRKDMMLELVLNDGADDLMPMLQPFQQEKLQKFCDDVVWVYSGVFNDIQYECNHAMITDMPRKDFALNVVNSKPQWTRGGYFAMMDGKDADEWLKEAMIKNHDKIGVEW